ncbi:MAG: DNA topoisomerase 3 [Bacteroidia bacterium]
MKVVLAEKPSVAKDLAAVLGATGKGAGYFEGNGYQVTWAVGHLVELADTKDYGYRGWQFSNLPIIPDKFILKVTSDQGRAKQFSIIGELFKKADAIICATDAGREGELIFRYIYDLVGSTKPIQRLWVSSQTDKALKDGFAKLKPGSDYDNLYQAARCRSEADWLVGINATQAYTLKYGQQAPFVGDDGKRQQPLSLGRVQTPVLKLLVDRYQEVVDFKPETYWELILTLEKGGQQFQAKWFRDKMERFQEEKEGQEILARLEDKATVRDVAMKPKTEIPPLLYDLTTLQKDANKRYNFSAQQTLDLAQDLYEKYKTLTYPRTDSRYLSDDIFPLIPDLLDNVARMPAYAPFVQKAKALGIKQDKNYFNNAKVSDHHAIIPTETDPSKAGMTGEHMMIYDLVVRRFIGVFLGNCQKELSDVVLLNAGETFRAKGTMISTVGWREIYFALEEALAKRKAKAKAKPDAAEEKDKEEENALPFMAVNDVLPVLNKELPKKKTKAPSIHTESSILSMMETAGKEMEDDELREAMKDRGLGTPATRAGMIERLLERGYIVREKKKLIPTERGIALIRLVSEQPIASPELTGEWESRLNKIAKGEYVPERFMQEVRQYTHEVVGRAVRGVAAAPKAAAVAQVPSVMPAYDLSDQTCPKCKQGRILKGKRAFGCGRFAEGCDFKISPVVAGKMLEREQMVDLLRQGITSGWVQGFTGKTGKRFDARLRLKPDFRVEFYFDREQSFTPPAPAPATEGGQNG